MLWVSIILSIPFIQTKLGSYATKRLNTEFNTSISVKKIDLSFLGKVQLEGVKIRDHHQDTLIFVDKLSTSVFNAKRIIKNEINLGSVFLDGVFVYMKTYKGETNDNMAVFIDSFDNGIPKDSLSNPFILKSSNVYLNDLNYKRINQNNKIPISFSAQNGGGNLQDLLIDGPNFSSKIRGLYFIDNKDLEVTSLTTDFTYSKTAMHFKNTILKTRKSEIRASIDFTYKKEDLATFNDKVNINAIFDNSRVAIPDLKKYYSELEGDDVVRFSGNFLGKLNNFSLDKFRLTSQYGKKIT